MNPFEWLPKIKDGVKWIFDGNDKSHLKRAVLFGITMFALAAAGCMGIYINHVWKTWPKNAPVTMSAPKPMEEHANVGTINSGINRPGRARAGSRTPE